MGRVDELKDEEFAECEVWWRSRRMGKEGKVSNLCQLDSCSLTCFRVATYIADITSERQSLSEERVS